MKLNKFDIVLLLIGAGIIFSEFPDMSQITQALPFMVAQFFYIFYFILLAKQSIWAFAFSILATIFSEIATTITSGYASSPIVFMWLIAPIIGYFMWYKNLRPQDGRVKVRSLTWPQFGLLMLILVCATIGASVLFFVDHAEIEDVFFKYYSPSLFVGGIIIEILIILRYRSLWSILLLINVFFPMLLWIIAGHSDSYNYPGGRGGGFAVIFMYFYWLLESGSLYAKMWLLKFVIYMYGSFLWESASKIRDEEDLMYEDGDNVNTKDSTNTTFLMRASQNGDFEDVKFFVEEGADINAKDVYHLTALTYAVMGGICRDCKISSSTWR